jgi:hypothetical protein
MRSHTESIGPLLAGLTFTPGGHARDDGEIRRIMERFEDGDVPGAVALMHFADAFEIAAIEGPCVRYWINGDRHGDGAWVLQIGAVGRRTVTVNADDDPEVTIFEAPAGHPARPVAMQYVKLTGRALLVHENGRYYGIKPESATPGA